jgi:hypothetical protein
MVTGKDATVSKRREGSWLRVTMQWWKVIPVSCGMGGTRTPAWARPKVSTIPRVPNIHGVVGSKLICTRGSPGHGNGRLTPGAMEVVPGVKAKGAA